MGLRIAWWLVRAALVWEVALSAGALWTATRRSGAATTDGGGRDGQREDDTELLR
ncbi:MAG TPA: hypothetical protein VFX49_05995 [Chloroflexota bacterium]|nr:hypothetical protein [Chloroflexota bacterium]